MRRDGSRLISPSCRSYGRPSRHPPTHARTTHIRFALASPSRRADNASNKKCKLRASLSVRCGVPEAWCRRSAGMSVSVVWAVVTAKLLTRVPAGGSISPPYICGVLMDEGDRLPTCSARMSRERLRPWRNYRSCCTQPVQLHRRGTLSITSAAHAKGAIGRLDFNLPPILGARREPECAARSLNNRAARSFVWIVNKLVESNL
jgi:hypothetical protein